MIHFITLQKAKALALSSGTEDNAIIAAGLNHELMKMGFVLDAAAMRVVASQEVATLVEIHGQLITQMREITGGDGYKPFYNDFPQGVIARGEDKNIQVALELFWESGGWDEASMASVQSTFEVEPDNFKVIRIMAPEDVPRLFEDMLYSNQPLSAFDKDCLRYHFEHGGEADYKKITFQETAAFVGSMMLDEDRDVLPMRFATDVLRTYCAYCGGDEGLKEVTRFRNPTRKQRRMLMATLEQCDADSLEESLKSYREPWLRLLYYLHPTSPKNKARYPVLAGFAERLRNEPKSLKTYNSKVEEAITREDPVIFELLKKRPGAFMRRLDHMVRIFGVQAFHEWLTCKPSFSQLLTVYNHFYDRAQKQEGRAAVLASQSMSEVVTYEALEALDEAVVNEIVSTARELLSGFTSEEVSGKVYIDPLLYWRPLSVNNRASSLSLDSRPVGTVERYEEQQTLRLYIHWEGRSDIDLSGFLITRDLEVIKVGWNGRHTSSDYLVYSGDNRGHHEKNAEYLDINTQKIPENVEWIVIEARIYSGPESFDGYGGKVHAGWMSREAPNSDSLWLPERLEHALVLRTKSRTAYLMAYHPSTQSVVYLDVAMGNSNVSSEEDALKMKQYLSATVTLPGQEESGAIEIKWDKLNSGHVLHLLAEELTDNPKLADVVFDENITSERISVLMKHARTT